MAPLVPFALEVRLTPQVLDYPSRLKKRGGAMWLHLEQWASQLFRLVATPRIDAEGYTPCDSLQLNYIPRGFGVSCGPSQSCLISIEKYTLEINIKNFYCSTEGGRVSFLHFFYYITVVPVFFPLLSSAEEGECLRDPCLSSGTSSI